MISKLRVCDYYEGLCISNLQFEKKKKIQNNEILFELK